MNNNNLYNTNNFIGITHNDYFKTASNALAKAINTLDLNSSNYTSNVSNILDNKIINVNINSSNYTRNTSNAILARYDPMIENKIENKLLPVPLTYYHTYISNSNVLGEIRFWCKSTSSFPIVIPIDVPDFRVKIDVDGKLKVYYTYDPAINATFFNGWVDVGNSIAALNASDANIGISLATLEAQILANKASFNDKLDNLIQGLYQYQIISQAEYDNIRGYIQSMASQTSQGARGSLEIILNNIRSAFISGRVSYIAAAANNVNLAIAQNSAAAFFLGVGGIAFAAATGIVQNLAYLETISSQINSNIEINPNLTRVLKDELISSNLVEDTYNFMSICSNMSNMTISQGYINTYNTSQQYIPFLKSDTLDLNTGNITNINGITANELITSGKIKENNKFLDATYLTSNHLYNLAYNYTEERRYPSKTFTTVSPETSITLLEDLVYYEKLYLDTNSISYGSGFYEVYSSSTYGLTNQKSKLFNYQSVDTTYPRWGISLYNSGTGNYQGNSTIDNVYYGDWVIIKLPQQIMLTRYRIYQRIDSIFPQKAPSEWKVYGSNDGITFTEIIEASQMTRLITNDYTFGFYEKTLNSSFTTQYQWIGFVFGKLLSVSGNTDLLFSELQIFGKEIISNSIVSNIYTTSNAVKNIIIYDTPVVAKHFGFYISINTPIVIGTSTYYKYDIDLRQYTNLGVIQIGSQSGDTFRSFKIRVMLGTMFFSYIINDLPNVCFYEVFMSYKNTPAPPGVAGLNACAIGYPPNTTLQTIMPNNLFVIKNGAGDINYITVVSTNPADVRVIIEDMIG